MDKSMNYDMDRKSWMVWMMAIVLTAGISVAQTAPTTVLFHSRLGEEQPADLLMEGGVKASYSNGGLLLQGNEGRVRLDRYYSLGQRTARWLVRFSDDAVMDFCTDTHDVVLRVNVPQHQLSVECNPRRWTSVEWLNADDDVLVELQCTYGTNRAVLTNMRTGQQAMIEVTSDGQGGSYAGAIHEGFLVGGMWDYYCMQPQQGSMLVQQMAVVAGACNLLVLIYGDSITEPEYYYPREELPNAWTQLMLSRINGKAMTSARGGCTIREVLLRIRQELPYVKAKYVMVTIGTNGGNTEENLCELVEYIQSQGSIPILNNIPCNERNTQVETNRVIEKVRRKYGLNGCRFDVATSLNRDGLEVDKSMMWFENLKDTSVGMDIYHHPNSKGSQMMFYQSLIDIPEIYE